LIGETDRSFHLRAVSPVPANAAMSRISRDGRKPFCASVNIRSTRKTKSVGRSVARSNTTSTSRSKLRSASNRLRTDFPTLVAPMRSSPISPNPPLRGPLDAASGEVAQQYYPPPRRGKQHARADDGSATLEAPEAEARFDEFELLGTRPSFHWTLPEMR
jgi:hypothetical protein